MKPRRVRYAPGFHKALRNCTPERQRQVIRAVEQVIDRTAENSLRPERKQGLEDIWAFRVTGGVRVFYRQRKDAKGSYSELIHVGPHYDYRTVDPAAVMEKGDPWQPASTARSSFWRRTRRSITSELIPATC
jgi:mRNA-degrading endonuclease RelE of RelBE toxin-antitoxin system